ncbi:uncharacterized protein B0J16DRAFT_400529 [Fusarium flagelliforme]|uniref:uncharacterized protein n=1 Tax=Fusarium flagelliforme TaxID=2675880 RepID=UPI001E8D29F8|nr:uncharacterized protein B0J16DRAFT_400529 [Fusarium flagelliforme]KAH7182326.1 hypothetical protein B0J16DRAFT_400529 [Fusarium flagelliforme]
MDSPQPAKKHDVLSQATKILGKRPQSRFDVSGEEGERVDDDGIHSRSRRLRRKVQRTSALLPELPEVYDFLPLSGNGDHEPVTRFEYRQHEQQVVAQSRGGIKGMTGNQPLQFATRTMTRSRSQQSMLKNPPDSHLGTAPKRHQSIAGPSRTSNHKTRRYTAYANLGYGRITVNPKTSYARDDTSPSNTGELVDGSVQVRPSLRHFLTRDYEKDPPNQLYTDRYSCNHYSRSFTRMQNLEQHIINRHGGIHDRTTSDRTNISSSSSFEISSKKESYEGTSAKANDTRHYFPQPSSRTAYTTGAQINPVLIGGMPPGRNLNAHALQHISPAAQQQLLQQQQVRQLMAQQAAFQANRQDGLPIEMAKSSQFNPKRHYAQALAQQFALPQHQQEQQEQERQARQPLPQGSGTLTDIDHLFEDADHWRHTLSWDNKGSTDKRDCGSRRLKTDLRDPSANFSAIGHYTISQDNTEGEEARKSLLLAKFGNRCTRNRDAQELEKQKALRRDGFSF